MCSFPLLFWTHLSFSNGPTQRRLVRLALQRELLLFFCPYCVRLALCQTAGCQLALPPAGQASATHTSRTRQSRGPGVSDGVRPSSSRSSSSRQAGRRCRCEPHHPGLTLSTRVPGFIVSNDQQAHVVAERGRPQDLHRPVRKHRTLSSSVTRRRRVLRTQLTSHWSPPSD